MKKNLQIAAITVLVLFATLVFCSILNPYTASFRTIPHARLTIDGKEARGWVHRSHGKALFLTHGSGERKSLIQ
jgi:hypothetical protein